jgi:spore coat polysaccharide biosynthesis protein SpsF
VTLGFKSRSDDFSLRNFEFSQDLSDYRWTIDYPEDLEYIRSLAKYFHGKESVFTFQDILAIIELHPKLVNSIGSEFRNIALRSFGESSGEADE